MLKLLGLILLWALIVGVTVVVYRVVRALVTKPNLRYYLASILKDVKNMYYRYHV